MKLHKGAEALTLRSALKLIVANSLIGKPVKLKVFYLIGFVFFKFNVEFCEKCVKYFVVAVAAFLFLSVFVRSH